MAAVTVDRIIDQRLAALDLPAKIRLLTGADFWSLPAEPAIGLQRLVMSDGPAGVRGERWDEREPSTNIPSPTALAATWDWPLVHRIGTLLAHEARAKGVHVLLAPTINLHRTPFGGRHFECFSEDPLLTGVIGAAFVRGVQDGGVAACAKHFVANDSETERWTVDVRVSERALRELYLLPFELLADAAGGTGAESSRCWSVMAAYNSVNGHPMTASPLLAEVLREEWAYDGLIISDWYAARDTVSTALGELDLVMPGPKGPWGAELEAAVRDGRVPESAVDAKVARLLRLAARVGALDGAPAPRRSPAVVDWEPDQISAQLRTAAAAGMVLARNQPVAAGAAPVLPLDPGALRQVALIGPAAMRPRTLGGGSATVHPPYTISPFDGLRAALGPQTRLETAVGVHPSPRLPLADASLLRTPDGEPGMQVRLISPDGSVLLTEHRQAGHYDWLGTFRDDLPISAVTAVEVHARLRAPMAGEYRIGGSGVGRLALRLDGATVFDTELALPPGADPVEAIMRPPQQAHSIELKAGDEVAIILTHWVRPAPPEMSFQIEGVLFQFNLDPPRLSDDEGIAEAVALAASSDAAIVVVGTTEEVESEGFDRQRLELPGRQDELVRAVAAACPRTVAVVNSGAPVLLPWAEEVPAVLLGWFGGQEFGAALADVLLGRAEPGGRLPTTWPDSAEGLPSTAPVDGELQYGEDLLVGYRWYDRAEREPRYPFGHGLGYTEWEYLQLDVPAELDAARGTPITVRVRNAGQRPGREVVQVYVADQPAGDPAAADPGRPKRWLAGFSVVEADPGQEVHVSVEVPALALRRWDAEARAWIHLSSPIELHVGRSSRDLRLTARIGISR